MAETVPQNYANHRKFVPLYHFVASSIFAVNQVWAVVRLVRAPSWETGFSVVLAFALLVVFYYLREFPLKVQDRLIVLEMKLRLQQVLPADLRGRIQDLAPTQLIGLRFASDAEMTDLVRDVLANNIESRETIKRKIKNWRADNLRA